MNGADVYRFGRRARSKLFSLAVARSFASFGPHTVVEPPVRLHGEHSIVLGAGVYVGGGSWLQVVADDGELVVGDGVRMSGLCTISAASCVDIGRSALFARGVYVADHRHAFGANGVPIAEQGIDDVAPVVIGDGAWLGEHVVVCPGVTVGAGAVVGANSVVTSDVPAGSVAVGAPARMVSR